jgi:hypothetical protein
MTGCSSTSACLAACSGGWVASPPRGVVAFMVGMAMLAGPGATRAESAFATAGSGTLQATARLDFSIVIPRILFLQVGTGTLNANNTAIDQVQFTVPAATLGTGAAVPAANSVTARVLSSVGAVTLQARTTGALSNGAQTISFSHITAAAGVLTSPVALPHPTLGDNVANTVAIAAINGVVNRDATWTFSYSNPAVVQAGTYGGVNTLNSRVTYTASTP